MLCEQGASGGPAGCGALYNVWSRPTIARSAALSFTALDMAAGGCGLAALVLATRPAAAPEFDAAGWWIVLYLGVVGAAATFLLWAFALAQTTPTRVAISVAVDPVVAALAGTLLLGEPRGLAAAGWPGRGRGRHRPGGHRSAPAAGQLRLMQVTISAPLATTAGTPQDSMKLSGRCGITAASATQQPPPGQ